MVPGLSASIATPAATRPVYGEPHTLPNDADCGSASAPIGAGRPMSASIASYRRHEALPVPITRRGRALQTVGGSSHLFDALSAWPVCRVTYSILRFRGFARPDFLVSSRLLSWLSDPPRRSDSPASRRSSLSFTHQVQSVPNPHPDGAGAKSDAFVRVIPPKTVFAQATEPPRFRQPHDAVQLQRREFRQLLLAGLRGFGHRPLCTS